jgi:hypothetical protein
LVKKIGDRIEKKLGLKDVYQRNKTDYSIRAGDKNKIK